MSKRLHWNFLVLILHQMGNNRDSYSICLILTCNVLRQLTLVDMYYFFVNFYLFLNMFQYLVPFSA